MNQLSFQPAYDVFHTAFRFLRLRRLMPPDTVWHYDQLRIIDFYLLFFFRAKSTRLKPQHNAIKKLAKSYQPKSKYENQPDDRLIFERMSSIQRAAMQTLLVNDYFDVKAFENKMVKPGSRIEDELLDDRIVQINETEQSIMEALKTIIQEYEFLGRDGLKDRTCLMEYRYDAT